MGDTNGLRIGELAAATGLTVRTLHHYDRLGLLRPSGRTEAGHRRYDAVDVERLYRIAALRQLGFRLRDVGDLLDGAGDRPLSAVVDRQLADVQARIDAAKRLEQRLTRLRATLADRDHPTNDDLLTVIARTTMLDERLRHDYSHQATRYDATRGASPSVLGPLRAGLAGAPGPALLDIGGGTGNYAAALRADGWRPTVVDISADMRRQAADKRLPVLAGDATDLPVNPGEWDAAIMVSMLHQVADWRTALTEARRALRPGGRLVVTALVTADHLTETTWAFDLFPSMREFALPHRPSLAELTAELPGVEVHPTWITDLEDASIAALCAFPEAMLDERTRRQTSFFERLERDNPAELANGLAELRAQLARDESPWTGREAARERLGDGVTLTWRSPTT